MTIRVRLLAALAYVLVLAIVAFAVPLAVNLRARVNAEVRTQAQAQADVVAATAADLLGGADRRKLSTLASTAAAAVRGRVLIVNRMGAVLADSGSPAQLGASYESRPEIERALGGRPVQVQRASKTLGQEILATAVPVIRNGRPVGAVRVTQSIAAVHGAVGRAELGLILIGVIVLMMGLAAGAVIAAQVGRPIKRIEHVARRVAQGDLSARAHEEGSREQRSLARSFNEMTTRIGRLLRAQQDFVADASHQLRTPLTGLRLRLEEAKASPSDENAAGELDAAIAEVDRLSRTVDELLVLSRAGERELQAATIDLGDVAEAAGERWRASAVDRAITLTLQRERSAGSCWAARLDLDRALDALVENALHYSPSASTVTLIAAAGRVEVLDQGPGLAEGEQETIFERFRRGSAGRGGRPGSGLGLSIARELAREWGGDVTLANRPGGGAIATLWVAESGLLMLNRDASTVHAP